MSAQLCLEPILEKHASKYAYFIRMIDLHLRELIASGDAKTVSADDIAAYLPKLGLPPKADTRFTAAVWKQGGWIHAGFTRSTRCVNHHRTVSLFRRGGSPGDATTERRSP